MILSPAGTSAHVALIVNTDTGSIKINSADNLDIDAADDITIDTAGGAITTTSIGGDITIDASDKSVIIRGTEEVADAIVIDADGTAGGITVDYGTGNMVITGTGASADFTLDADLISIDGTGVSNITCTNAVNEDFTISTAGAADHSLIIQTSGTAADSLQVITTAGGIDITNGGAAGGEDIDVDAVLASLNINADEDVADAITIVSSTGGIDITADGAVAKDLDLVCTNGSTNISAGEDIATAIVINASTGGIDITADGAAAKDLDLVCTNGSTVISGGEAIADAVTITAGAGGVDITAAATFDIDITATGGTVLVIATEAAANQFKVDAQGTIADGAGDAIVLETTDGGILLNADNASNGDIELNAADDLTLTTGGDLTLAVTGTFKMAGALISNNRITTTVDIDNRTLLETESGSTIVFTMTGAAATATLPEATGSNIGMWFILIDANVTAGRDLTIDPEGVGTINGAAAGNFIKNEADSVGEGIMIFSTGADTWFTTVLGTTTWTVE